MEGRQMIARRSYQAGRPKGAKAARVKTARLRKAPLRPESIEDDCLMLEAGSGVDAAASPTAPDRTSQLNSSLLELSEAIEAYSEADWSKFAEDITNFETDLTVPPAIPAAAEELSASLPIDFTGPQ